MKVKKDRVSIMKLGLLQKVTANLLYLYYNLDKILPFANLSVHEESSNVTPLTMLNVFSCLDENNWNPVEWDRAAEELTWERVSELRN